MFNILANGSKIAYGIKRYMVSTIEEIKSIPLTSSVACGSSVLVTSTGEEYILDSARKWVKLKVYEGQGEEVIYEGGDLSEETTSEEIDYDGGDL